MVSLHGKGRTVYTYGANYSAGFDLEGKKTGGILGRNSELANPPNKHQLLSEKPTRAREARARPVAMANLYKLQETSCQTGHRLPSPTTGGIYKPSRAWRLVRDFKDKPAGSMCFQRAAEKLSSRVQTRSLAGPRSMATSLLLAACECSPPGSSHRNGTTCRSIPGSTGRLIFLRLTRVRNVFRNRFSKCKVLPNPERVNPQTSHSTFC